MPVRSKAATNPTEEAGPGLRGTLRGFVFAYLRDARSEATAEGISLPQLFLLGAVARSEPVPVTRLTRWTGGSAATITGVLDGLDAAGLLRRAHGTTDRRQVIARLTPRGRRLVHRLESRSSARWRRCERGLSEGDRGATIRVVRHLSEGLSEGAPGRGRRAAARGGVARGASLSGPAPRGVPA